MADKQSLSASSSPSSSNLSKSASIAKIVQFRSEEEKRRSRQTMVDGGAPGKRKIPTQADVKKLSAKLRAARKVRSQRFRVNWDDFVRTVKVHEMLKCLEVEHRKIRILRKHVDVKEVIVQDADVGADVETIVELAKRRADTEEQESGEDEPADTDLKQKESDDKFNLHGQDSNISLEGDESESFSNISEKRREIEKETTRNTITNEEFEEVVALCEDKFEQKALRETFAEKRNRDKYLHNASERRRMTYNFINGHFFTSFMLCTIILSTLGITLLTFETISLHYQFPLVVLDSCVMAVFVVEATLKISIYREDYFKLMWNILDMSIVIIHFVEVSVDLITKTLALSADINASIYFKGFKSLRALRLLRVIKFLPNLQVIATTIFQSFLSLGSIFILMALFIFVFAVMGTGLFREDSPDSFGTIWYAFLTLFQLLTLDNWTTLISDLAETNNNFQYWIMFFYLFCYIVIEYFVFLNLFVAVLVDNFQISLADAEIRKQKQGVLYEHDPCKWPNAHDVCAAKEDKGDEDEVDGQTFELQSEDYYSIPKQSKEGGMLDDALKTLTAIDFQRFIWRRRSSILNSIMDNATLTRASSYMKAKKQEEDEHENKHENDDNERT